MTAVDSILTQADPRFPIGPFRSPTPGTALTHEDRRNALQTLAELPEQMRNAVSGLDPEQLDTPYRAGGWTVRELVHHVADSHMCVFVRIRRALTEDWPTIRPFNQDAWALLPDSAAPVEWSLELIESLHARLVMMLQRLTEEQWQRGFTHAERGRLTIEVVAQLYAWHSRHHIAHITHLRAARGW